MIVRSLCKSRNAACGWLVLASGLLAGCTPTAAPVASAPPPPPPVACSDYAAEHGVAVVCRYHDESQMRDVWAIATKRASIAAVSLGFTHLQLLGIEKRAEMMSYPTPVDCQRTWSFWGGAFQCTGGENYQVPVAWLATSRFFFLSAEDARARANDPLIPPDRRPIDARMVASQ